MTKSADLEKSKLNPHSSRTVNGYLYCRKALEKQKNETIVLVTIAELGG
jgi:threonine synthase